MYYFTEYPFLPSFCFHTLRDLYDPCVLLFYDVIYFLDSFLDFTKFGFQLSGTLGIFTHIVLLF